MKCQVYHVNYDAGSVCLLPLAVQMSTAIAVVWNDAGFAVAADGRKCEADTKRIVSEYTQKIFPMIGRSVAYLLTGTAILTKPDSHDVLFDFTEEIPKALESLKQTKAPNLWHFAQALGEHLLGPLNAAIVGSSASSETNTQIFLAGYYKGPECVDLSFIYSAMPGEPVIHEVSRPKLEIDIPIGYGSVAVFNKLHREDPDFAKYGPLEATGYNTLASATEIAEKCIRAHCDPLVRDIDPVVSAAVGGHVHVAQITAAEGFKWVIEPKLQS